MAIPFGSLGALEERVLDGRIVNTVSQGRFLTAGCDDASRNSYQVADLKHNVPGRPMVYLLGGSSVRECCPTPGGLADAVSKRAGRRVGARMIAGSMQKLAVQLAIIDNLPRAKGGIVVIGVNQLTFASGAVAAKDQLNGKGLLAESPTLRSFTNARLGLDLGNSIRDGLRQYLDTYLRKRGVAAFKAPWTNYHAHRYGPYSVISNGGKRAGVEKWLTGDGAPGGAFDRNFAFCAALLEACVKRARARGFEVVLMEDPQDISIVGHAWDKYKDEYRPVCRYLRDTYGAHYINLNGTCGLVNGNFRDLYHLIPSGRAKWMPKLADQLAQVFIDSTPPAVPVVTAAAGDASVSLSWVSDPPDADLDHYEVWRSSTGETGAYVQVVPSTTGVTYLDGGLTNGATYWYKVVAVDLLGGSSTSSTVSATPAVLPSP
jgi:hypothetical protein